ncbi:MAG: hypothetical protein JWM87_752 [Candidatus Eremiobacteraeota bacterium]|nr:hypothetical protein [Candidatus Eremiobacteraeota bacterium]
MTPSSGATAHPIVTLVLPQVQTAINIAIGFFVLLATLTASAFLIPKARLIRERNDAQDWVKRLEGRLTAQSSDLAAVLANVEALRGEIAGMRDVIAGMHSEALVTRKTLVVALRYVAALMLFIRSRRPVGETPAIPAEISDGVLDEIRAQELGHTADVQGASGMTAPVAP